MKTRLFGVFVAITFVGCTSKSPRRTAGTPGTAGTTGTGGTTGAAGLAFGGGRDTSGGGATGAAGSTSGAAGSTTGAAGATGAAGSTSGAAGPRRPERRARRARRRARPARRPTAASNTDAIVAGDGPNQVPTGYTGLPLGGTPQSIPGTIQIENYDTGGPGVAYQHTGTGHGQLCGVTRTDLLNINCTGQQGSPTDQTQGTCAKLMGDEYLGYINQGDWLNYTVTVKEAGTYVISTHAGVAATPKLMFTFTPTVTTCRSPAARAPRSAATRRTTCGAPRITSGRSRCSPAPTSCSSRS